MEIQLSNNLALVGAADLNHLTYPAMQTCLSLQCQVSKSILADTIVYHTSSLLLQPTFSENKGPSPRDESLPVKHLCFQSFEKMQRLTIKQHRVKTFYYPSGNSYAVFRITRLKLQLICRVVFCHYLSSYLFCPPFFSQLNRLLNCFRTTCHWFYSCYLILPNSETLIEEKSQSQFSGLVQ